MANKKQKTKRVLFISSTGGHLDELMQLKALFDRYEYYIVTEKTKSNLSLKEKFKNKVTLLIYGTKKSKFIYPFILLLNSFISLFVYLKFRPQFIVSTGSHTAGPMCCIGKLLGSKIIYIETFANSKTKSVAGSLVYKFADLFIVQWEEMLELYPKGTYGGWIY